MSCLNYLCLASEVMLACCIIVIPGVQDKAIFADAATLGRHLSAGCMLRRLRLPFSGHL